MSRRLLILRHAKSAWDIKGIDDFERALAPQGEEDALQIGRWIRAHGPYPEHVISSPALRAKQTVDIVAKRILNISESRIRWDQAVYGADASAVLKVLSGCPAAAQTVLLVGHNPGLRNLIVFLCGKEQIKAIGEKKFPTAALAQLILPDKWDCLETRTAHLISIIRVRDLFKE